MQSDIEQAAGSWDKPRQRLNFEVLSVRAVRVFRDATYWRGHIGIFLVAALSIAAAMLTGQIYGFPVSLTIYDTLSIFTLPILIVFVAIVSGVELFLHKPGNPARFLWQRMTGPWRLPRRFVYAISGIGAATLFMSAFSSMKSAIGVIQPFYFDPVAAEIDRMIFGRDAWEVLQPLLGHPGVTFLINISYNVWLIAVCAFVVGASLMVGRDRLRAQYLIAFFLSWMLIGSLLATILSSAGPCFYSAFYEGDPYAGLMAYLNEVDKTHTLWALSTQQRLLDAFRASETGFGSGISAVPSMHLAMTMLMVIFSFRLSRAAGWVAVGYLAIIYVGSIHLGWHYAIDGVISIALVPGVWWLSGKIADWPYRAKRQPLAAPAAL